MYGTLVIRPINGNLTRNTDLFSKMDPYVKVILGSQQRETSVARNAGKHPQWRDQLTLKRNTQDDIIKFEVWDEDIGKKDDFVGSGALAIATVQQKGNKMQDWIQLSYKGKNVGQILVDVTFIPEQQNMMMPNMQAMPNQFTQPSYQGTFPMMTQNQGVIPQQTPQYQQPNLTQQNMYPNQGMTQQIPQYYQQPNLTQQNVYQNQGYLPQQTQTQTGFTQQGYAQQGYPQQVQNVQQMPIQQKYPQQQKVDTFAPPIEQANTINRNQMRHGTQTNQYQGGMMYPQGNANQYGHYYP